MNKLRRGFKAQSERKATEIRKTLEIQETDPLSAQCLADHMGVYVKGADELKNTIQADLDQLTVIDADSWSAFTLRIEDYFFVVYNPAQSSRRINSVTMHELSHIMLGHKLISAGMSEDGHLIPSNYDEGQEAEADWLGGTLLLPRPALLWIRENGLSEQQAANHFQVSHAMLRWRMRMTGVDYQLKYRAKRR